MKRDSFQDLAPWSGRDLVHVVVDSPGGSTNKFKFDERSGLFQLSRVLPYGLRFPCDFGFIPGTNADDGDALDVLLMYPGSSFTGCLVRARLLGVICARQREKGRTIDNHRLIAVPVTPVNKPRERTLSDIPAERIHALEEFFMSYNRAQGRAFQTTGRRGVAAAEALVRRAIRAYEARKKPP